MYCDFKYRHNKVNEAKLTPAMYEVVNALRIELLTNHHGEKNAISQKKLAAIIGASLCRKLTDVHIWRAGYILRTNPDVMLVGYCSNYRGIFVDGSYEGQLNNLRFLVNQYVSMERSIRTVSKFIEERWGKDALPADIHDFLESFEETNNDYEYDTEGYDREDY